MSKNKNKQKKSTAVPAAPVVDTNKKENVVEPEKKETATKEQPKENPIKAAAVEAQVFSMQSKMTQVNAEGLDPNRRVDLMSLTRDYFNNPDIVKKFNISQDVVDNMNHINMIAIAAAWASEIAFSKTAFATKLRLTTLPEMTQCLKDLGINGDAIMKLPVKDGTVEVSSKDVKIPNEVKEELKEDKKKAEETVELDPTKIPNNTQLCKSLQYLLVNKNGVFKNITDAINLYRSYCIINATDESEKNSIKSKSSADLLKEISELSGSCPFIIKGIGGYLLELTSKHKSPVPAFCILRDTAKNKTVGAVTADEHVIADITKVLIQWAATAKISEKQKNIKVLSKDGKANKEAIDNINKDIQHLADASALVDNPNSDFADNLINRANFTDAEKAEDRKIADEARKIIAKSYYNDVDLKKSYSNLDSNIQQYAGIITSMFRDVNSPLSNYSATKITELIEAPVENKKGEKKDTSDKSNDTKANGNDGNKSAAANTVDAKKSEPAAKPVEDSKKVNDVKTIHAKAILSDHVKKNLAKKGVHSKK